MVVADVVKASSLTQEHVGRLIFIHRAKNDKGHAIQKEFLGRITGVEPDGGGVHVEVNAMGYPIHVFFQPDWDIILPTENSFFTH